MQFSSWMGQVSKNGYFVSADNVLMTTITKFKLQVVFQYGFRSFLHPQNKFSGKTANINVKKLSFCNNV